MKKFKETKFGKILGKVGKVVSPAVDIAADALPFGTTAKNLIKGASGKLWKDKDGNGKISIDEIQWPQVTMLVSIILMLRFDIVDRETLEWIVDLAITVLAGR